LGWLVFGDGAAGGLSSDKSLSWANILSMEGSDWPRRVRSPAEFNNIWNLNCTWPFESQVVLKFAIEQYGRFILFPKRSRMPSRWVTSKTGEPVNKGVDSPLILPARNDKIQPQISPYTQYCPP
jgi:hypothetical protein